MYGLNNLSCVTSRSCDHQLIGSCILNRINNPDYADREIEYKKEGQSITDDPEVFIKSVKEVILYYDEKKGSFIRLLRRIYARDRKKSSADE